MNKCDFCTQSSPNGKCFWDSQIIREDYCLEAIRKMVQALGENPKEKKRKFFK